MRIRNINKPVPHKVLPKELRDQIAKACQVGRGVRALYTFQSEGEVRAFIAGLNCSEIYSGRKERGVCFWSSNDEDTPNYPDLVRAVATPHWVLIWKV